MLDDDIGLLFVDQANDFGNETFRVALELREDVSMETFRISAMVRLVSKVPSDNLPIKSYCTAE